MRRLIPLLSVMALALGFAPAPPRKPPQPGSAEAELAALEGEWRWVSFWVRADNGVLQEPEVSVKAATVKHGVLRLPWYGDWQLTLDPKKGPKQVDGQEKPTDGRLGCTFEGIYRLNGDVLTLNFRLNAGDGRPSDFSKPVKNGAIAVFVRRRVGDAKGLAPTD